MKRQALLTFCFFPGEAAGEIWDPFSLHDHHKVICDMYMWYYVSLYVIVEHMYGENKRSQDSEYLLDL